MNAGRVARLDRTFASEARWDLAGHLNQLLNDVETKALSAEDLLAAWGRFDHQWACAILGRDPRNTTPLTADEALLL